MICAWIYANENIHAKQLYMFTKHGNYIFTSNISHFYLFLFTIGLSIILD
jgi:hypothetical protein